MTSKTYQKKMIKKKKRHAHKANRKKDQQRIAQNHALLYPPAQRESEPAA